MYEWSVMARILVTGGCKQGKTTHAQRIVESLAPYGQRVYVATMIPTDAEDMERICRHRKEREGKGYVTVEWRDAQNRYIINDLTSKITQGTVPCVIFDSVTALLQNNMFLREENEAGEVSYREDCDAPEKTLREILALTEAVPHIVLVSDDICRDGLYYGEGTERYTCGLSYVNTELARHCDQVIEVTGGELIFHKNNL